MLVYGARHQLDLIAAEAARRGIAVHIVIDFVHVPEKLRAAAGACTRPPLRPPRTYFWAMDVHPDEVEQIEFDEDNNRISSTSPPTCGHSPR